ncbi:MAG: hypothetical protein J6F31_10100 [Oscillospiraceae bacterium]|nr:hypothetical protein [Oscillospiraceae bacterium]
MKDIFINSFDALCEAVRKAGILPYFSNSIEGFSIEENVDPALYFGEEEGVWEWKGPAIRETGCAYGKLFGGKAVFMDKKLYPDFANWRRDGYDFDARYEDGLARHEDKVLYDLLCENTPVISKALKKAGDYRKGGRKGFDTAISRLQAQGYVLISDFVYGQDKLGRQYGWGIAEYSTPEAFFGKYFTNRVYKRTPEESREKIKKHIMKVTGAGEAAVEKFMK